MELCRSPKGARFLVPAVCSFNNGKRARTGEGLRRFWSTFPLARVPFWYRFFEPQPNGETQDVLGGMSPFAKRFVGCLSLRWLSHKAFASFQPQDGFPDTTSSPIVPFSLSVPILDKDKPFPMDTGLGKLSEWNQGTGRRIRCKSSSTAWASKGTLEQTPGFASPNGGWLTGKPTDWF